MAETFIQHNTNKKTKQAVVRKHNKPGPRVAHRGIARFLRIDQKVNHVVPWSLHTFPESFMQSFQPFSRNLANKETNKQRKKERYKEINRKQYPVPRCIGDGVINLTTVNSGLVLVKLTFISERKHCNHVVCLLVCLFIRDSHCDFCKSKSLIFVQFGADIQHLGHISLLAFQRSRSKLQH